MSLYAYRVRQVIVGLLQPGEAVERTYGVLLFPQPLFPGIEISLYPLYTLGYQPKVRSVTVSPLDSNFGTAEAGLVELEPIDVSEEHPTARLALQDVTRGSLDAALDLRTRAEVHEREVNELLDLKWRQPGPAPEE